MSAFSVSTRLQISSYMCSIYSVNGTIPNYLHFYTIYSIYTPVEAVVPVYEGLNVPVSPAPVAAPIAAPMAAPRTSSSVVDWLEPAADSDEKVE